MGQRESSTAQQGATLLATKTNSRHIGPLMGDGPRSRSGLHSPVVHEQVRHPQQLGVDPNVLDVGVLALVPGQVVVHPLLGVGKEGRRIRVLEQQKSAFFVICSRFLCVSSSKQKS